jgi:hypothetical protein
MKKKSTEFGDLVDPKTMIEPEVFEKDHTTGVATAQERRDFGPAAALQPCVVRDPRTGQPRRRPAKRVIEVLRRNIDGQSRDVAVVVTTLRDMYRRKAISEDQYTAGVRFKTEFDIAGLDGMRVPSLDRIPAAGRQGQERERIMEAKDFVFSCMKSLGGTQTLSSRALWNIVGLEMSMRDYAFATNTHWNFWGHILVAALDQLSHSQKRQR